MNEVCFYDLIPEEYLTVEEKASREAYHKKAFLKRHNYDPKDKTIEMPNGQRVDFDIGGTKKYNKDHKLLKDGYGNETIERNGDGLRIDASSKVEKYNATASSSWATGRTRDTTRKNITMGSGMFKLKNKDRIDSVFNHEAGHIIHQHNKDDDERVGVQGPKSKKDLDNEEQKKKLAYELNKDNHGNQRSEEENDRLHADSKEQEADMYAALHTKGGVRTMKKTDMEYAKKHKKDIENNKMRLTRSDGSWTEPNSEARQKEILNGRKNKVKADVHDRTSHEGARKFHENNRNVDELRKINEKLREDVKSKDLSAEEKKKIWDEININGAKIKRMQRDNKFINNDPKKFDNNYHGVQAEGNINAPAYEELKNKIKNANDDREHELSDIKRNKNNGDDAYGLDTSGEKNKKRYEQIANNISNPNTNYLRDDSKNSSDKNNSKDSSVSRPRLKNRLERIKDGTIHDNDYANEYKKMGYNQRDKAREYEKHQRRREYEDTDNREKNERINEEKYSHRSKKGRRKYFQQHQEYMQKYKMESCTMDFFDDIIYND